MVTCSLVAVKLKTPIGGGTIWVMATDKDKRIEYATTKPKNPINVSKYRCGTGPFGIQSQNRANYFPFMFTLTVLINKFAIYCACIRQNVHLIQKLFHTRSSSAAAEYWAFGSTNNSIAIVNYCFPIDCKLFQIDAFHNNELYIFVHTHTLTHTHTHHNLIRDKKQFIN